MAKNVWQNASVAHILDFNSRIDPASDGNPVFATINTVNDKIDVGHWSQGVAQPEDIEGLRSIETECLRVHSIRELERDYPHAAKIAAVYALETLSDDDLHAEESRPLGRPIP